MNLQMLMQLISSMYGGGGGQSPMGGSPFGGMQTSGGYGGYGGYSPYGGGGQQQYQPYRNQSPYQQQGQSQDMGGNPFMSFISSLMGMQNNGGRGSMGGWRSGGYGGWPGQGGYGQIGGNYPPPTPNYTPQANPVDAATQQIQPVDTTTPPATDAVPQSPYLAPQQPTQDSLTAGMQSMQGKRRQPWDQPWDTGGPFQPDSGYASSQSRGR